MLDYLLTTLFVLTSVIWGGYGSLRRNDAEDLFSKDYTTVLKGICCIIVVMVHVKDGFQNPLQDAIGSFGFVCVTLFFMVSAYGMQLSVERKASYLCHFWRNRLLSLLVPCLLINVCFYVCTWLIRGNAPIGQLFYLNHYVVVLLEYCLWFYLVILLKNRLGIRKEWVTDSLLIAGVVVSSLYSYFSTASGGVSSSMGWCYERLGLVWGLLFYRYMPHIKHWLVIRRTGKLVLFSLLALVAGVAYLKLKPVYFYGEYLLKVALGVVIILWMLLLTVKRKYGNLISLYLGKISYEVYLSHGMVMGMLASLCPQLSSGWFIFLTYCITLGFSSAIHAVGGKLVEVWRAK